MFHRLLKLQHWKILTKIHSQAADTSKKYTQICFQIFRVMKLQSNEFILYMNLLTTKKLLENSA